MSSQTKRKQQLLRGQHTFDEDANPGGGGKFLHLQ